MTDYQSIIVATGDGSCELELVPEFGGLSNRLRLSTSEGSSMDIIAGLADRQAMENNLAYRGVPLFPFVNRLDRGAYQYHGVNYQFEQNESERKNALHGFLQQIQPEVFSLEQAEKSARAILRYHYDGSIDAYPFPVEIEMTYSLRQQEGLEIKFAVTNCHTDVIPVGIGWHPYFHLGASVDTLSLRLPAVSRIGVDDRMLPSGEQFDFNDFENLALIGSRALDDCFQILPEASSTQASTVLWSEEACLGIELWQKAGYDYLQVCIAPDRQSIAIEPVSCGINAFNTGEGLRHLAPEQTFTAHCGLRLIQNTH